MESILMNVLWGSLTVMVAAITMLFIIGCVSFVFEFYFNRRKHERER